MRKSTAPAKPRIVNKKYVIVDLKLNFQKAMTVTDKPMIVD